MAANKEVLAIGCHPDDIEEFVGGTLLLFKKAGYTVTLAVMTRGESGSKVVSAEEIARIRDLESRKAAAMMGVNYINLGFCDERVFVDDESTKKLVKVIRERNPQVILTHPTTDYMKDHENTAGLVLSAAPAAKHANYETDTQAGYIGLLPHLYHWDMQDLKTPEGQYAPMTTLVDISEVIEEKLDILGQHESQAGSQAHRQKGSMLHKARLWARIRGYQIGVEYAEGFNQQLMAGFPVSNSLANALGLEKVYSLRG